MKINADIYVKDVPGTLVSSLEPISTLGGNIVGVVHNREQVVSGRISVNVIFYMEPQSLDALKKEWKARDIIIADIGEASFQNGSDLSIKKPRRRAAQKDT